MKLKRFLSVVLTLVMLTSGIAAAAADGDGVLRFEGEYFNLTLGGVPTAVTSANVMRDWDGQSNGAGMYALSNGVPEFDTEFYAPETGVYTMKFVSNAYAAEEQKGWCSQFKYTVNGMDVDGKLAARLAESTPGGSVTAAYEAPVALNKGINTLKFTATTAFTGEENNGKYLLYLDYVEFTPSDNVEILCEGEEYTAATGEGSIDIVYDTNASGGKCFVANKTTIPSTLTYNSYAPAGGSYKMNVDFYGQANGENWLSPISVKITQNGSVLLDKVMTASGSYYSFPTAGEAGAKVTYPSTAKKGETLFTTQYGNTFNRYEWLDSIELEKGDFEIEVSCISYRSSNGTAADSNAMFGLDVIRFVREDGSVIDEGSRNVVIEGEKPESKMNASMDAVEDANASGGAVGISAAKTMPAYVTYKSRVDIAGDYNLSFSLWDYEKEWMAPLAVTVKQGDTVIIDNKAISSTGKYDVVDSELGSGITVKCDITASKGTSKTLGGSYNFINFDWLEDVALGRGDIEVTVTDIGFSPNNTEKAYMGIDAIKFELKKDYSEIKIGGDEAAIIPGDTLQLTARDKYNSLIEAEEDVTGISWESSNENILSVDGNGLVTAKNPGKANVTLTVTHDGETGTAQREMIVMTEAEQFVIKSVTLEGSEVAVKYTSNADLDNVNVSLIAGRFAADNAPLSEIKTVELSGNAPYMYRTVRIPLDSTDGKIRLFAWRGLEEVVPVFSATDIK